MGFLDVDMAKGSSQERKQVQSPSVTHSLLCARKCSGINVPYCPQWGIAFLGTDGANGQWSRISKSRVENGRFSRQGISVMV